MDEKNRILDLDKNIKNPKLTINPRLRILLMMMEGKQEPRCATTHSKYGACVTDVSSRDAIHPLLSSSKKIVEYFIVLETRESMRIKFIRWARSSIMTDVPTKSQRNNNVVFRRVNFYMIKYIKKG